MAVSDNEDKKLLKKNKASINVYMKYSGMGIQMAIIITVLSYAGVLLDAYLSTKPTFTVILSLAAVILAMYIFIKAVLGENNAKDNNSQPFEK
jgi:heme/copper-type cytochrome/quinol oxidase subunit 4